MLLDSRMKDFPNDSGNGGFRGFPGNFNIYINIKIITIIIIIIIIIVIIIIIIIIIVSLFTVL